MWGPLLALPLLSLGCQGSIADGNASTAQADDDAPAELAEGDDLEVIRERLTNDGTVDVLVTVDAADAPAVHPTALTGDGQSRFDFAFERVLNDLPSAEAERFRVYRNFPTLALRLRTHAVLERLLNHPHVLGVFFDRGHETSLTQSLALIGQSIAQSTGHDGDGTTVAVIDTGTDYTRAAFGSCSSPGGSCKVVAAVDTAAEDGALDTGSFHGTNVAGIVLGVAPGAKIAAIDAFSSDGLAYSSALAGAVDWVLDNRTTYNIVAMNWSLGSGSFSARCNNALEPALSTARALGVLAAIATGNSGYKSSISQPACAPSAVAVGAVYDANIGGITWSSCSDGTTAADRPTCFSNSAAFMDLMAPGAMITAAGITMGGTSQASPHVAGAIAVLRASFPGETADRTLERLKLGGVNVTDPRNGVTKPRIDLPGAIDAPTSPTGTINIVGDAEYTRSPNVTLAISTSGGATQMCLSNATSCTNWVAVGSSKAWTLSSGSGTKTVYARFRNASGYVTDQVSDSIVLDTTPPTAGTLTASGGSGSATLSWSGQTDALSGIASYKLAYGTTVPSSCNVGASSVVTGSGATVSGLVNGTTYGFRLCAIDNAGNMSPGASVTVRPAPEHTAPTGSVTIANNAAFTAAREVTLTVSGSDTSGVVGMCVSNGETCSAWASFAASKSWSLTTGTGLKTVRVWLRDAYNNVSDPVSDTITLDQTAPTNPTVSASGDDGSAEISWTTASDAHSGVDGYKVVYAVGTTAPSSCGVGTVAYEGSATSTSLSSLTNGLTYTLRVCAVDNAGNRSTGATVSVRPAPEYTAPTGSVTIDDDDSYTSERGVSLAISANDASGVTKMCISNGATCTAWVDYATTVSWTLPTTSGAKAIRVWFRDTYGNVSTPVLDTITLDTTAPSSGTLYASSGTQSSALVWLNQADGHSGLASFKVVYAAGSQAPANCNSGTVAYTGTDHGTTVTGLGTNTLYSFRLCAIDNVGNMSAGTTRSVRTFP